MRHFIMALPLPDTEAPSDAHLLWFMVHKFQASGHRVR